MASIDYQMALLTDFKIIILSITSNSNFTIDNSGNTLTIHNTGVTAAGEVKRSAVEAEQKKVAKAAPEEKKSKTASRPTYFEMIKEALLALNERGGSSPYAIAKYMEEKHKSALPANFRKTLGLQLKNSAAKGKLTKIKASYKLSDAGKKEKSAVAAAEKPRATKAEAVKKVAAEKGTPENA